jgi:nucleotide-binding universal stress UspA family protein
MSNIRCIVAATDFSTFSERAVQRAAHIARQHDAELHLVHVVRPLDLYPSLTLAPDELIQAEFGQHDQVLQEAEHTRLDDMASSLTRQFGIRIRTVTRLGRPHTNIAAYAQEASADLLVAGSRGENTLMELFLGSTASRLLRLASCPVLIARIPAEAPYRQVLAAVDFSPVSAAVVAHALDLASGAPVEALHVLGSEVEQRLRKAKYVDVDIADWLTRLRAQADKQLETLLSGVEKAATVDHLILPGSPPAVICRRVEEGHADLVVVGRHGHGGDMQEWLLGSVSKDVAQAAACDVLVIGTEWK